MFLLFILIKSILADKTVPIAKTRIRAVQSKLIKVHDLPSSGSKINIRLLKLDLVSKLWSGITQNNQYYKLVLPNPSIFSRHDILELEVKKAHKSSFGGIIIFAESAKKLSG